MSNLTPADIANSPSIMLGGEKFFIPKLALKQNRVVVDRLKHVLPQMMRLQVAAEAVKAGASTESMLSAMPLDDETTGRVADAVYAALTRAQSSFTREQFDDLPMGIDELLLAVPTVMMQSFAFMQKKVEAARGAPAGEALPEAPSSGTSSSSESAEPLAGPGTTSKTP